jgi:hypothetical protein
VPARSRFLNVIRLLGHRRDDPPKVAAAVVEALLPLAAHPDDDVRHEAVTALAYRPPTDVRAVPLLAAAMTEEGGWAANSAASALTQYPPEQRSPAIPAALVVLGRVGPYYEPQGRFLGGADTTPRDPRPERPDENLVGSAMLILFDYLDEADDRPLSAIRAAIAAGEDSPLCRGVLKVMYPYLGERRRRFVPDVLAALGRVRSFVTWGDELAKSLEHIDSEGTDALPGLIALLRHVRPEVRWAAALALYHTTTSAPPRRSQR